MNNIPSISQIYNSILQDFSNRLNVTFPAWGRSYIKAWAMVNAAIFYAIYLKNVFVYRNMLPDTADSTANGGTLERFGMIMLNRLPFNATQSQYTVIGTGQVGATIDAGRTFSGDRNGVIYTIDSPFTFTAVQTPFVVRSLTAGVVTRLQAGDIIQLVSPVTGVVNTFTVLNEVVEPTDAESLESYRTKVLQAYRYRSRGGSASDYRYWGAQVVGVRNIYPYTGTPLPGVNLFIESETGNGVPSIVLRLQVGAYVDNYRPLGIYINYFPVVPVMVDITIAGSVSITVTDQGLIQTAIEAYLKNKRPYIEATDGAYINDTVSTNEIISIIQDVKPNVTFGTISVTFDNILLSAKKMTGGNIPVLNSIVYV